MLFKNGTAQMKKQRDSAVSYLRAITDEEWSRFKKAVENYRKADKILSGENTDSEIGDIAEQIIETPPKQ